LLSDPAPTASSPLSLHDALPIYPLPEIPVAQTDQPQTLTVCALDVPAHGRFGSVFVTRPQGGDHLAMLGDRLLGALGLLHGGGRSEEHTSELQSRENLVCRLLLE